MDEAFFLTVRKVRPPRLRRTGTAPENRLSVCSKNLHFMRYFLAIFCHTIYMDILRMMGRRNRFCAMEAGADGWALGPPAGIPAPRRIPWAFCEKEEF